MPPEVILTIRVIPRAKRSELAGRRGDAWLVRLQSPPVDGAANEELVELLAARLAIPKKALTILSGETSRQKRVRAVGVDAETAQARLGGT